MKKIISFFLCTILLIAVFTPFYTTVNARLERKSVTRFCNAVSELSEKYSDDVLNLLCTESGKNNIGASANRLVVKTTDKINGTNEVEAVYGLGWAVLQYDGKGDMLADYEKLNNLGYSVEKDRIFTVNDVQSADVRQEALKSKTEPNQPFDYAYVNSGADYIKSHLNNSSEEIVVGVMDSGIDYNHREFCGRYIDNPVDFSTSGQENDPMDELGHGTACASIVIQSTPNNVKVKPYKIFNGDGAASLSTIISAVEYILAEKDKPDIVNMSFCGYELDGQNEIQNELASRLIEHGIIVCAAAGNESAPAQYASPSGCDDVITVASHGYRNQFSEFSNYGKAVDITAPGENIYAAKLGGDYSSEFTGTSFAAPLISAACAYVIMQQPDLTPAQVEDKIEASAIYMGEDDSYYYGAGIISFINLIGNVEYPVPSASVQGGLYHDKQVVEFNDIPTGATLVYTTDKSIPTSENGTVYNAPITIENDTQLTFALVGGGEYLSPIKSNYYTIQYYAKSSDFIMISGVITSCLTNKKNIIVPDTINGKKPVELVASLFRYSDIESIVLPDSVTTLGLDCFLGAKKLKHIVANGVTTFKGDNVFYDCEQLRDVSLPNLKNVTASAFRNCKRLSEIDFGENLTELKNNMFAGSGLMRAYLPNVELGSNNAKDVFTNCPLSYCYIPNVTVLSEGIFSGCRYLYDLTIGKVSAMYSKALADCVFITKLDTSELSHIAADSLYACYIDTFYAPKCKLLPVRFGQYCYVRVIDLPNAAGVIGAGMLNCATTEELYLDRAVSVIAQSAFRNVTNLKIIYLPNVTEFYGTYTKVSSTDQLLFGDYWSKEPPLEIIWVPKANIKSDLTLNCAKLIFAPNTRQLNVTLGAKALDTKIILSEKVSSGSLSVNYTADRENYDNGPTIISQKDSYAFQYAQQKIEYGIKFTSVYNCRYISTDENDNFVYSLKGEEMRIPADYIVPCWEESEINKSRYASTYKFLLDFTNDNIINAKDYAVLIRYSADY